MSPRTARFREHLLSSLWFQPILFVGAGILLGLALPALDRSWPGLNKALRSDWLAHYIPATSSSSREMLTAMAAALATMVAVVASMTMVTVQLAASQYTPRLLRRFLSDPSTQRILGMLNGFGLVPFLEVAFGERPNAAASQPRVIIRILEVLAQIASVEKREPLRKALVQCGQFVREASRLAPEREIDIRRIQERWQELQRVSWDPEPLPSPPIH